MGNKLSKGTRNGISALENNKISSQVDMSTGEENDKISSQIGMATGKEQDKISSQLGMATGKENAYFLQNLAQTLLCIRFFNKLGNKIRVSISFLDGMGKGTRNRISRLENKKIPSQLAIIYEQEENMENNVVYEQEENMENNVVYEQEENMENNVVYEQEENMENNVVYEQEENMENNVVELQTKVGSFANERELLDQKNRELSIEVESLKSLLNEHNAKLAHLTDEMAQNASVLETYRKEKIDLQSELNESKEIIQNLLTKFATTENKIKSLEQLVNEGVKHRVDLIEQQKVTEHSLRQRNEILQEEVDRTGRLLDAQNQRVEELESALNSLNKDLDSKKRQPLQVRPVVLENGYLENGKPKLNGPLENEKPKPNHVFEMVTFFNSQAHDVLSVAHDNSLFFNFKFKDT